ncbi:MAG: glycoside hydrolase family 88 protein [Bacteroidetes bacterium]|nr:glycoside hydrolase family 88 protein [Bacteroidota bacterium]
MKTLSYAIILLICLCSLTSPAQTANNTWAVKFSNGIVYRYQPNINNLTGKGWEYSNSIILHGMEKVYNDVPDSAQYLNYIQAYVDAYVNSSGVISPTITTSTATLDKAHPGLCCLFLYEKTGLLKYKTAATFLRNIFVGASATYPKTAVGGIFWHKNNGSYNDIILIDGMYMLHPFLVKYGSMFNDNDAIDTAVNQVLYVYNQLYDPTKHLIKHAWNPTKTQSWADPVTGNSSEVWSRGMGWFTMALVDMLKYLPASHPRRGELLTALANLAIGIQTYQDPATGLWYQVVDRGTSLTNNYLETSGSSMFVYALKTAADSGWISSTYLSVAQQAWDYLKDVTHAKIDIYPSDGYPRINGFAPAMSVQTSAANYVQAAYQPVSVPGTTHPHGYAGILMAASVMEFPLLGVLPVNFLNVSAVQNDNSVQVLWENGDDSQVDYYTIEKGINGKDFTAAGTVQSNQSAKYQWVDSNYLDKTTVYYRIKAVSLNGTITYSSVMIIKSRPANTVAWVQVAPNPVKNRLVNVILNKLYTGSYSISIMTADGAMVTKKQVMVAGMSQIIESIKLPALNKGVYYLVVQGNDNDYKTSNKIFIN